MKKHKAKAVRCEVLPGMWQAVCSCGWKGHLFGVVGARDAAVSEKWDHLVAVQDAARLAKGASLNELVFIGNSAATATLLGSSAAQFTSGLVTWGGGVSAGVRVVGLPVDLSKNSLVSTAGDTLINTNGSLSCGAGLVVSDGSSWKNIATGNTYTR